MKFRQTLTAAVVATATVRTAQAFWYGRNLVYESLRKNEMMIRILITYFTYASNVSVSLL